MGRSLLFLLLFFLLATAPTAADADARPIYKERTDDEGLEDEKKIEEKTENGEEIEEKTGKRMGRKSTDVERKKENKNERRKDK